MPFVPVVWLGLGNGAEGILLFVAAGVVKNALTVGFVVFELADILAAFEFPVSVGESALPVECRVFKVALIDIAVRIFEGALAVDAGARCALACICCI